MFTIKEKLYKKNTAVYIGRKSDQLDQ